MENKVFLLLLILVSIVLHAVDAEYYTGSSALSRKSKTSKGKSADEDSDDYVEHGDKLDDEFSGTLTGRRNRHQGFGSAGNSGKSRSRWSSIYDDDDSKSYDRSRSNEIDFDLSSLLQGLTSNDRFSDGPTCHSLLDPQYPLFSDICGVIPQARYALPNFFGHYEKWQIVQTLTTVLGPGAGPVASDPACTRALRLLVCPLLFPPCKTRRDLLSILPCQPFCHGVKTRCPVPSLEHLPCEYLAPTSDVCPLNPLPYSSLLSSFGSPNPLGIPHASTGFPPTALSSLLAQSALGSGISPGNFQQILPGAGFLDGSLTGNSYGTQGLPTNSYGTQGLPTNSYGTQGFPTNSYDNQGFSSQPLSPFLQSPGLQATNFYGPSQYPYTNSQNKPFNAARYAAESLSPVLVDFPSLGSTSGGVKPGRIFPSLRL